MKMSCKLSFSLLLGLIEKGLLDNEGIRDILNDIECPTHDTFGGDMVKIYTEILDSETPNNLVMCQHTVSWKLITCNTVEAMNDIGMDTLIKRRQEEVWRAFLRDVKVDKLIDHMRQAINKMPRNNPDQAQHIEEIERLIADIQSVDMQ